MSYRILIHTRANKFIGKHSNDTVFIERLEKKYLDLSNDPYSCVENSFHSTKCPRCKKTRIGNYRIIYYIIEDKKIVEIIDIGLRKNIWD